MHTGEAIGKLLRELEPFGCKLIAVTKTYPPEAVREAYNAGHRAFGENKAQELRQKYEALPKDIEWHMIGHLQGNKVKYIAPFVHLIHSIDSMKLLATVNKEAAKINRIIPCLLQFHIASESTKFGFTAEEAGILLQSDEYKNLQNVTIAGVMGMATFTDDTAQVRREFRHLAGLFRRLKQQFFADRPDFREVSMGMSGDYKTALEEGSTMVRIGSAVFGPGT